MNEATDPTTGEHGVSRFGYKASTASPLHQVAAAYRNDMGVTNLYATEEACAELQESCSRAALLEPDRYPGGVDISDVEMALVEFYVRLLAVPERRGYDEAAGVWEEDVLRGRTLFFESGCETCHTYRLETATAAGSVLGQVELNTLFEDVEPIEVLSDQVNWSQVARLTSTCRAAVSAVNRMARLVEGMHCPESIRASALPTSEKCSASWCLGSIHTPTSCCTTWVAVVRRSAGSRLTETTVGRGKTASGPSVAKAWPTAARTGWHPAANGERRRFGASVSSTPSTPVPPTCTTAGPGTSRRPSSGTAARQRQAATTSRSCPPMTAKR